MLPEASHQVFAQTNIWVGRDVVQRTTIWLLSFWSSFISEWNDLIILKSESSCCRCLPSDICSRKYMGWKKLFKKFQEGCLVHDRLWYLSGMKEAFLSPCLA